MPSIIVAVAVLEMNMEKRNVISMQPNNNVRGRLPKMRKVESAIRCVRPVFSAADERTNPPKKSHIRGLPHVATYGCQLSCVLVGLGACVPSKMICKPMASKEVAKAGIASVIQADAAKQRMNKQFRASAESPG